MTNKGTSRKSKIGPPIWSDNNWSVVHGKLVRPPGNPGKKNLFKYIGEKIPFGALDEVEEELKKKGDKVEGGIYCSRFYGDAKVLRSGIYF